MFAYGCTCAFGAVLLAVAAVRQGGPQLLPGNRWVTFAVFMLFAAPYAFKFQYRPQYDVLAEHRWRPVLSVTATRIAIARTILAGAIVGLAASFLWIAWTKSLLALYICLCQMALLSGLYNALHWGFRAENLFTPRIARVLWFPFSGRWPR